MPARARHHHYETGTYVPPAERFLPDDVYGRALDALVKGCVDVLFTNGKGDVLLGLRRHEPAKGTWWYVGGRMRCGERVEETARRHAARDVGVDVDVSRFSFVTTSTMNWEFRVQEPAKNGTCDVNVVLTATLTDEEISGMTRCEDEYVAQTWWPVEKILRARDDGEVGERVLRPIRNATRRMVFVKTENAMYEAVRRGGDDAEIARLARAASAFLDAEETEEHVS